MLTGGISCQARGSNKSVDIWHGPHIPRDCELQELNYLFRLNLKVAIERKLFKLSLFLHALIPLTPHEALVKLLSTYVSRHEVEERTSQLLSRWTCMEIDSTTTTAKTLSQTVNG